MKRIHAVLALALFSSLAHSQDFGGLLVHLAAGDSRPEAGVALALLNGNNPAGRNSRQELRVQDDSREYEYGYYDEENQLCIAEDYGSGQ